MLGNYALRRNGRHLIKTVKPKLEALAHAPLVNSRVYAFLGMLHSRANRVDQALESLRQATELQEGLTREKPELPDVQRALVNSYIQYSNLLAKTGKAEDSFNALQKAVATGEKLSFAHPENTSYRRLLAQCYRAIGVRLRDAGRVAEGLEQYQKAIELTERNTREAGDMESWSALAFYYSDVGHLELEEANYKVSIEWYQKSNSLLETLAEENPAAPNLKSALASNYINLGVISGRAGESAKEAESYEDGFLWSSLREIRRTRQMH